MSSAIVVVPLLSPLGLGLGTLTAIFFVAVPTVTAVFLGKLANMIAMTGQSSCGDSSAKLEECSKKVGQELSGALKIFEDRIQGSSLAEPVKNSLRKDLEVVKARVIQVVAHVKAGSFTPVQGSELRDAMEKLGERIAREEADVDELLRLRLFYEGRIREFFGKLREPGSGVSAADFTEIEKRFGEIAAVRGEDLNKAIIQMSEILTGLRSRFPDGRAPTQKGPGISVENESPSAQDVARARQEIEFFYDRIRSEGTNSLSNNVTRLADEAKVSFFPGRIFAIRDEVKLTYQKILEARQLNNFYRTKLESFLGLLGPASDPGTGVVTSGRSQLRERIIAALSLGTLSREGFYALAGEVEVFLAREYDRKSQTLLEEKLQAGLAQLDYVVSGDSLEKEVAAGFSRGEVVLLDTKFDEYKLLLRLGKDGAIVMRLVRIVESEKEKSNQSDFQKKKDLDLMREWCKQGDRLLEFLRENGVICFETLRVAESVDYMTIEQLEQSRIDVSRLKKPRKPSAPGTEGTKKA